MFNLAILSLTDSNSFLFLLWFMELFMVRPRTSGSQQNLS